MLGILSSPIVTVMWAVEQIDVHVLGSTPRASDIRIVMSACVNSAIVIGMYFLAYKQQDISIAVIIGVIVAWISSHNLLLGIGLLTPFNVVNQ